MGIESDTGFTYNPSSGLLTIAGELDAGSLDISGDADIDGTLETDALSIGSTTITSTAAELNLMDGGTSSTAFTPVAADRLIVNDAGTMKQSALSEFDLTVFTNDMWEVTSTTPTSGSGKPSGYVWYIV